MRSYHPRKVCTALAPAAEVTCTATGSAPHGAASVTVPAGTVIRNAVVAPGAKVGGVTLPYVAPEAVEVPDAQSETDARVVRAPVSRTRLTVAPVSPPGPAVRRPVTVTSDCRVTTGGVTEVSTSAPAAPTETGPVEGAPAGALAATGAAGTERTVTSAAGVARTSAGRSRATAPTTARIRRGERRVLPPGAGRPTAGWAGPRTTRRRAGRGESERRASCAWRA